MDTQPIYSSSNPPGRRSSRAAGENGAARGSRSGAEKRAKVLGWFSVALGLAQIAVPGGVARLIGAGDDASTRRTVRGIGLRELTTGIGILTRSRPEGWLWGRVVGDLLDIALLGRALTSSNARRDKLLAATTAVLGVTVLDSMSAVQLHGRNGADTQASGEAGAGARHAQGRIGVRKSITINRQTDEVYAFFRNLENLPQFMAHLESVRVMDGRSHWRAKAPAGLTVEWDAEVVEDRPNEIIAWRSLPGAQVPNGGAVRFRRAPGGRGTELAVELSYEPPGGSLGAAIAKLFGENPEQQISGDLRRLKQVLETGEVVHSDASIHPGRHPARPSERGESTGRQVTS